MTKRTQQTLFWFFQSFSLSNVLFMAVAFFGGGSGGGRFGWTGKPFAWIFVAFPNFVFVPVKQVTLPLSPSLQSKHAHKLNRPQKHVSLVSMDGWIQGGHAQNTDWLTESHAIYTPITVQQNKANRISNWAPKKENSSPLPFCPLGMTLVSVKGKGARTGMSTLDSKNVLFNLFEDWQTGLLSLPIMLSSSTLLLFIN